MRKKRKFINPKHEIRTVQKSDISKNVFLKAAYKRFHTYFLDELRDLPEGIVLELGAGEASLKGRIANVVVSDVVPVDGVDLVCCGESLPFLEGSLSAILMCNVFHHVKHPRQFLKEATRVLMKNGKIVMVEPSNTLWGNWVGRNFHHESLLEDAPWEIPGSDPVLDSNLAAPWIIFRRDIHIFEKEFPRLKLVKYRSHTPLLYLVSGGANYRKLLPNFTLPLFKMMEWLLSHFNETLGMQCTIVVTRL